MRNRCKTLRLSRAAAAAEEFPCNVLTISLAPIVKRYSLVMMTMIRNDTPDACDFSPMSDAFAPFPVVSIELDDMTLKSLAALLPVILLYVFL